MPSSAIDAFLNDYPPPAFHFKVTFALSGGKVDCSFQDVSGITATRETEEVMQGGENSNTIVLPRKITYSNLVLKRGIAPLDSPLSTWCGKIFDNYFAEAIQPCDLWVHLMDGDLTPVRSWSFVRAYPVKWSVDAFNSTKNEVAIETIELKYRYFYRTA